MGISMLRYRGNIVFISRPDFIEQHACEVIRLIFVPATGIEDPAVALEHSVSAAEALSRALAPSSLPTLPTKEKFCTTTVKPQATKRVTATAKSATASKTKTVGATASTVKAPSTAKARIITKAVTTTKTEITANAASTSKAGSAGRVATHAPPQICDNKDSDSRIETDRCLEG